MVVIWTIFRHTYVVNNLKKKIQSTKMLCYEKDQPVPINRSLIFLIQKVESQLQICSNEISH